MSESVIIWSVAALVVAAIVVPYFVSFRRRLNRDSARKAEAARLGIDRPTAQFPFVDPSWCIGCGACVTACPEGDVLGIVGGTATVINGLRCVGHGLCEAACPVGAIEVGLGDLKSRTDLPRLAPDFETSIPGLFVAGELGGLALFKNAVVQGRAVGSAIAQRSRATRPRPDDDADVVVVGAGPAGLSAAITALEHGLRPLVLEQEQSLGGTVLHYPRRKLVLVQNVELPLETRLPGAEYAKEDLLALLERLMLQAKLPVRFGQKVTDVRVDHDRFVVKTDASETRARFVVLALGRRGTPRKLGVPGEELPKVMYKLVDADSYRRQRILVVGGGDSAIEAVIGLAQGHGNEVTLSYRKEKLVRIKQKNEERFERLVSARKVRLAMSTEVVEILPRAVKLRGEAGTTELPNDFVFVFAGGEPPLGLLTKIGVRLGGSAAATA